MPSRIEPSAAYSILLRERSRMVLSMSSTALGRTESASSVAAMASTTEAK